MSLSRANSEPQRWVEIGRQGLVCVERIVSVGPAESAAMRRLLGATPLTHLVVLTGGRKRRTLLLLDSGHVVVTALEIGEVVALLDGSHNARER